MAGGGSEQPVRYEMQTRALAALLVLLPLATGGQRPEDYRLPRDLDSLSYALTLEPDLQDLVFSATLVFSFVPIRDSLTRVILNSKNLYYLRDSVLLEDSLGRAVGVDELEVQDELERVVLSPSRPLEKGQVYTALFKYRGNITEDGAGLYRSSYTDPDGLKQWMLVSQLRPVHARKVFPCLDDPSFRARFKLTVWHHPAYVAVSNMPPLQTTVIGDSAAATEFLETPRIPVFLAGVLVSRLGAVQGEGGFESLATPRDLPAAVYSAEIGPQLAAAMENLVHLPYPQIKTHQVALPRLVPVAMENWGLFNFRRENILYLEGADPTVQKQTSARFSGHEVSHAWLGNSVTVAWWDWLWLSEMFAMYLEYFLPHIVDPRWRMEEQMVVDLHMSGLAGDSPFADPLTTKVLTPQQISDKFMGLTYTKGPGLLRMVQNVLGLNNFFRGIRSYLEKHWESSVTPLDLWRALEKEGSFPTRLEAIMATWTEQPGYPLISVSYKQGAARISQSAYKPGGGEAGNGSWWVPLSYATASEPLYDSRPKVWLPPAQTVTVPVPRDSILLLNVFSSGFFRVNYDDELWSRLSQQLHSDHETLPPLNRAQLVDDALALAKSGDLDVGTALQVTDYLSSETDFIVWKAASVSLQGLADRIAPTEIYPVFKKLVMSLTEKVYRLRGLVDLPQDGHTDRVQREIVSGLACRMGNQDCANAAAQYAETLLQGRPAVVSPNVKAALMCTALQDGNSKVTKYFLTVYGSATQDKAQYLSALSCSKDPEVIKMLLITPEEKLSDDEWKLRYSALASRRENANNLLNALHQNVDQILSRFGSKGVSGFIGQIGNFLATKNQSAMIADFERLGVSDLSTVRSNIKNQGEWLNKNIPSIIAYLKSNKHFGLIL